MHTHVTHHGTPCPSLDEMLEIVDELNLKTVQLISRSEPVAPILGLSLQDGIRCTTSSCDFSFASERSYRRHCQEHHVGITPSSQPCKVHRIFKNRAIQFVVRVDPTLAIQHPHGTLSEYLSILHPKQEPSTQHLNPTSDPRKLTAFLHNAKWHDFIRGLSLEGIQSLIVIPRKDDTLFPVVEEIHSMFKSMCEVVEGLDVLTRRHIHTPKGDLQSGDVDNLPFGRPQTDEYLARCANNWSRYICALLRSMDGSEVSLHLSPSQREHCLTVHRALVEHRDLRKPIQSLSFSMLSTYGADVQRDNSLCSLMRFIVFWHLREDGTFHSPSSISPNLASITFCLRSIAVLDAHSNVVADHSVTLLSYYRDNLLHLLKEGYPTPFNSLRQLTHLVASYAYNTVKLPDMHWNLQRDTLSVKGYPLQINLIPKMVQTLCSKANDILAQLLLGIDASAFDRVIDTALQPNDRAGWPVDPLRNTDVGFSFVHSPDNAFQSHLNMVLEHIYSTPSVFQIYHTKDKEAALRNYLRLHHEFVDLLMTLAHTTTPGAARGTELGPLRAVNSIDGPRNFFFLAGSCAVICQYLKTRSNTGRDGFVVTAFARQVSSENILVYEAYLYVVNGKTVQSSAFSNILRFAPYTRSLPPGYQGYPPVHLHHHDDLDVPDDAIDACFGHSSSIPENTQYGLVYDDLPGLTENMYVDALRLASQYHCWLGLGSSSGPSDFMTKTPSESHRVLEPVLRRLQQVLPALEAAREHSSDLVTIENNILERCLPIIQDTISTTLSHKVPWTSHLRISPPHPLSNPEPILVHPSRLSYLSALFRRQNTHFSQSHKARLLKSSLVCIPMSSVVLPTGGGKSAVYQTPCFFCEYRLSCGDHPICLINGPGSFRRLSEEYPSQYLVPL
ncbi:hypothetical protein J3R83DRAFT_10810 [Lanmaoa asiatica]|nr:hypothetical protein J3R83DRAFT_10810 [Lanmaoa asiatica]